MTNAHHLARPGIQGALLCALTAAAYVGVLQAGFVWDDHALVLGNSLTASLAHLPQYFTSDLWAGTATAIGDGSGYWRPLMLLSLALDRAFFGLAAPPAHLHSLAWHLLAVLALHRLLLGLVRPLPALVGAAVFALHPLQSEAVVWVAARNDTMAAALVLASLAVLRPAEAGGRRLLGGALLAGGAVLSKESALLVPVMLLVLDLARSGRPVGWRRHAVLWGAVAFHVGARFAVGVASAARPPAIGWRLLLWDRPLDVLATYGSLLAWPWPLSGGRDLESLDVGALGRLLGLGVLVLLPGLLLLPRPRRALAGAGLALAGLAFLPSVLALADKGLLGERYAYLSLAGVGIAVAAALPDRVAVLAVAGAWILPWLGILHVRLPDWHDDVTLWRAALRDTPSTYVQAGLAGALRISGEPLEAAWYFRAAIEGHPPQLEWCPNVVGSALEAGRLDLALAGAEAVTARGCSSDEFRGYHAAALALAGRWEEAGTLAAAAHADPMRRADLVRAAGGLVDGDCREYDALRGVPNQREAVSEQVVHLLTVGGQESTARAFSSGELPCRP